MGRLLAWDSAVRAFVSIATGLDTEAPRRALVALECAAFGRNRHREERSDVAIQESQGRPSFPWIASPRVPKPGARNDGAGSTQVQCPLAARPGGALGVRGD
jgi:hypothetical protein